MHPKRSGWFSADDSCQPTPPLHQPTYRLVLLGPPGVGKGTQAHRLCQQVRTCHLSTGDLFRAAKCEGAASPAMKQAVEAMRRGELISDDLVVDMVRERAHCLQCGGGFLLDGFPRTVFQAEALDEILMELDVRLDGVLCFELPFEEIVLRLSGRRTCGSCKAVFHVVHHPPRREAVCDHCEGELIQRADDQPDAISVRMKTYEEETQPLIDFYRKRKQLHPVPAHGEPQAVFQRTMYILEQIRCATA